MFGDLRFCKNPELIENYDRAKEDDFEGWDCHHRLETHFSDGTPRPKNGQLTRKELIALGMYYDRPADELILLKHSEHSSLHNHSRVLTNITKNKISASGKGKHSQPKSEEWKRNQYKNPNCCFAPGHKSYQKGKHYSEEEKERLYASRRKPNENMKGRLPANARQVICVESGVTYKSVAAAKRETGISRLDYYIKRNKKAKNGLTYKYLSE